MIFVQFIDIGIRIRTKILYFF